MGVEQYLLAFMFLASYSLTLSQFSGGRGRGYAVAIALTSAVCYVALDDPWESGVLVVAFGLITVGGLAAAGWCLWALLGWDHAAHDNAHAARSPENAPSTAAAALDALGRRRKLARAGHAPRSGRRHAPPSARRASRGNPRATGHRRRELPFRHPRGPAAGFDA